MTTALWRILITVGKVTVLLLVFACHATVWAEDANGTNLHVSEFRCEFRIPMGRGDLNGLMASDETRSRIAIYWIEPTVFRENSALVRYCDLILDGKMAYYWVHATAQPGTVHLTSDESDPPLPRRSSPEAVIRSSLAVVNRIRHQSESMDAPLAVGKFFHGSRGRAEYSCKNLPEEADGNDLPESTPTDVRVLNTLPHGRDYSKQTRSDGAVVWSIRRAMNGQPVVTVTIQPARSVRRDDCVGAFDPNTLGQWALVPAAYRTYWASDRAHSELDISSDGNTVARELCGKIDSYFADKNVPSQVRRAMDRLRFKTAMLTSDPNLIRASAQVSVAGLCQDDSLNTYESFLELARISGQIEELYPQQTEDWLRPLVEQLARHAARNVRASVDRLTPTITANGWFTYGILLFDELRKQGVIDEGIADVMVTKLRATRMARTRQASDPCSTPASVQEYLSRLNAAPPRGTIDMNDVQCILAEGLAKHYTEGESDAKSKLVADVTQTIRLVAGEGPFCGDREQLTESIAQFSRRYLAVEKIAEPIRTVLATFLALSFCDLSIPEDHEVLFSQFCKCLAALRVQVNTAIDDRGLNSLVTAEDVDRVFDMYERIFRRYIDDPLWPPFKFPLSPNEEARLAGALELRFMQLEPVLDEIALKVKYGGTSAELKTRTIEEISRAAQSLLPQAAFLRKPPYPGVSCQYRGGCGFTAVIREPLYREGDRPKEKFKAMKYFHLGHRLEDIVERERELTRVSKTPELGQ